MVDDQLTASVEQVSERFLAVGGIENVVLLNLDPRQLAPLGAHLVTQTGKCLFLLQMRLAGNKPFVLGHNFRMFEFDVVHKWVAFKRDSLLHRWLNKAIIQRYD